jgi:hypothetical protein
LVKRINSRNLTEIVLFQGESAMRSHQRLFSLDRDCYLAARESITESILLSSGECVVKLHIVTGWLDMLRVALWTCGRPSSSDVFTLLRQICKRTGGLNVLKDDVNDIFLRLYRGGRLDVFRQVCRRAKSMTESKLRRYGVAVHCHLVVYGEERIIASSL